MPDSAALKLEATIAAATDAARNPYASSHINAAHARLIEVLIKNPPPAFPLFSSPDNLEEANEYLWKIVHALDEVVENITGEADLRGDYSTIFADALHDNGPDFNGTAADRREDAREQALEFAR